MEPPQPLELNAFLATTIGFLVYLAGAGLTRRVAFLRNYNIPEPVSGGLVAAGLTMAVFVIWGRQITFDLAARDYFLLLFFAGIGLNARLADLARGGRGLAVLLGLTVLFILMQNMAGLGLASAFGMPPQIAALLGSAALIGGHGTVIAWGPQIAAESGVAGVAELGIAVATLGLVFAALIGGPIAKFLIARHGLAPDQPEEPATIGVPFDQAEGAAVTHLTLMRTMVWLHVTLFFGFILADGLTAIGLQLPNFVPCLLMGIVLGNLGPLFMSEQTQVRRTPTLAIMSDFALGTFLAMSLMSLELWTLAGSGALLLATMIVQTGLAIAFCLLLVFPLMGRRYDAAVLAAGFGGFAMGATPTAIANMTAVTKRYGPAPLAFVILPLVSAFFVDIANSFAIQAVLGL